MTNGGERLDRIERIQEQVAIDLAEAARTLREVVTIQREMAARQQYHDEAFERFDAEMKVIKEAIAIDAENIRALVRIAERHNGRLDNLEGGV